SPFLFFFFFLLFVFFIFLFFFFFNFSASTEIYKGLFGGSVRLCKRTGWEDNARIATAGYAAQIASRVIACGLEVSALTVTLAAPVNAHGLL
ncbi:hypothetical protein KJR58_24410, partial [Escherichia coli]|nr:hypothetical protein [Escherichia coli]